MEKDNRTSALEEPHPIRPEVLPGQSEEWDCVYIGLKEIYAQWGGNEDTSQATEIESIDLCL